MQKKSEELLDLALKSKDLEKKLEYCVEYLQLNPGDGEMWIYKGQILDYLGRHGESLVCGKTGYELLYDDDRSYFWGVFNLIHENYETALESLDDLLRTKPDYARGWLKKGSVLFRLKRWEEGLACVDKSMSIGLSKVCEVEAWCERASTLYHLGKQQEALRCFDNALDIDPCNGRILGMKGAVLLDDEMARYEEASRCFNRALELLKNCSDEELVELTKDNIELAERKLEQTGTHTTKTIERQETDESAKTGERSSRHCVKCRSSIPLDAIYCTECGTKQ